MLPLFPLGVVLFPRTPLPLHIFEERYKDMIGAVLREKTEFGVVLATSKGIANVGCTAFVEQVFKKYDDGRMDILTVGRRRFEILHLDDEQSFLRGDVLHFDDDEEAAAPTELREQLANLGQKVDGDTLDASDPRLSFALAQRLPDLETKQILLSMRSEEERLRYLLRYLPDFMNRQRLVDHMRRLAPLNGHGKHLQENG